jgi:hypothetical protein
LDVYGRVRGRLDADGVLAAAVIPHGLALLRDAEIVLAGRDGAARRRWPISGRPTPGEPFAASASLAAYVAGDRVRQVDLRSGRETVVATLRGDRVGPRVLAGLAVDGSTVVVGTNGCSPAGACVGTVRAVTAR